jgi:hypothetical protein
MNLMENDNRLVRVFLDDNPVPLAEYRPPVKMTLDTTKLTDGKHILRIIARSTDGREGIKEVPFTVRNGPAITVVGLQDNDVVDHHIPITINAYGSERPDMFIVTGSETPAAIPAWVWVLVIAFIAWGLFFLIRHLTPANYALFVPLCLIRTKEIAGIKPGRYERYYHAGRYKENSE